MPASIDYGPDLDRNWFQSRKVAALQCFLVLSTTVSSWAIALYYGHVKLWPIPMISHCGVYVPEKYVFSIGLVVAASLMFLFIWIVETAGKIYSSKAVAWALGFPCSLGLMLLAVCNCEEEPTAHYIGAVAYFVCFALWCVVCSFKEIPLLKSERDGWVMVRRVLAIMILVFTFVMLYLFLVVHDKVVNGRIPVCEWGAVICSELFIGTFYFDLGDDYYIEQVKVDRFNKKGYKKLTDEDDV